MFFIGATGHFLTLILTVCLPFVFILTGKQGISLTDISIQIEVHQNQHEIAFAKEITSISNYDIEKIAANDYSLVSKDKLFKKIPLCNFNIKKEWFYIESCGNKAPPLFHCTC